MSVGLILNNIIAQKGISIAEATRSIAVLAEGEGRAHQRRPGQ